MLFGRRSRDRLCLGFYCFLLGRFFGPTSLFWKYFLFLLPLPLSSFSMIRTAVGGISSISTFTECRFLCCCICPAAPVGASLLSSFKCCWWGVETTLEPFFTTFVHPSASLTPFVVVYVSSLFLLFLDCGSGCFFPGKLWKDVPRPHKPNRVVDVLLQSHRLVCLHTLMCLGFP